MCSCIRHTRPVPPVRARRPGEQGQATVEAAFLLPIILLLLMLLAQPAILLYDRMVMENAAAEACRLLATRTEFGEYGARRYQEYVQRRLASVPPVDVFHVSPDGQGWQIELIGDESSGTVQVSIRHRVRPLPLLGWGADLLRLTDADGCLAQEVSLEMPCQPAWALDGGVGAPASWPSQWEE